MHAPGGDGDETVAKQTGIIAGMSGSPVYVDGSLLGALAYGWGFSKEPIGGVTPFTRMAGLAAAATAPASSAGAVSIRPSLPELSLLLNQWLINLQ